MKTLAVYLLVAQLIPIPDFQLKANLDVVSSKVGGATFHANDRVNAGLWQFECRSGLQVATQRYGAVFVYWTQPQKMFFAPIFKQVTVERRDVFEIFTGQCPAMGTLIGYNLETVAPPDPGMWALTIQIWTSDGAGRTLEWFGTRNILIQ